MMAYMDDLGKQFADLDKKYERFGKPVSRQERDRYLHIEISKCIEAHYKIQQWVYVVVEAIGLWLLTTQL